MMVQLTSACNNAFMVGQPKIIRHCTLNGVVHVAGVGVQSVQDHDGCAGGQPAPVQVSCRAH